ncbi:hypothetical protein LDENG_00122050 [Lucifuga dentata]|nr:hypothetical protein LDENG_00122050 [Lucifuga dentata]
MTTEVQSLLRARNSAFKSGDRAQYSAARADLQRGIKAAKEAYKRKVEDHLTHNNPRLVWQGLQHITNYKGSAPVTTITDASLAEELNHFFARFEAKRPHTVALPPQTSINHTLTLQEQQVRRELKAVNPRKAAGPDGVLSKVLCACADQLAGVLTKIFNLSLSQATIPSCLKPTNTIIKFADDTTVVGLIIGEDKMAYREEVQKLAECSEHNLLLNTSKTKEMIIDFRRHRGDPAPLYINGDYVQRVSSFKFLGTHITEDLTWTVNTTVVVKKARQRLHFLRVLRRNDLEERLLVTFFCSTVESVLSYYITVWYASCSEADRKALQRVIKTAQEIISCPLPSLEDIASSRSLSRARKIVADPSHPGWHLFNLLPSGRWYRCLKCRTNRFKNSFYPWAIRFLNS